MDYIEQKIDVLFENKINYQKLDKVSDEFKNSKIRNMEDFFERIKSINGISLIVGSNGIGKTYLLEKLKRHFELNKINVSLIKFRDYDNLHSIKEAVTSGTSLSR